MTKRKSVMCSCGKKFMHPQELWDHHVRMQGGILEDAEDSKSRAVAAERERCARIVERMAPWSGANACAAAIRSGEPAAGTVIRAEPEDKP